MNDFQEQLGRRAFDAYTAAVGGTTYDGHPISPWEELEDRQRRGWIAAAGAVYDGRAYQPEGPTGG